MRRHWLLISTMAVVLLMAAAIAVRGGIRLILPLSSSTPVHQGIAAQESTAEINSNALQSSASLNHAAQHPSFDPNAPCTCDTAKYVNGWCHKCNVGFIAGHRVESALLFETLDAHGHLVDLSQVECESCQTAIKSNGFCTRCGRGYVDGLTYFSRLTHGLAQGMALDQASVTCELCRSHFDQTGWCDACGSGRGIVGNVAISDRKTFEVTAGEYKLLFAAIEKVKTCELCACAMVVHRTCPICLIDYSGDKPVQVPRPPRT